MENPQETPKNTSKRALWAVLLILVLAAAGYGVYAYLADQDNENVNNSNEVSNKNTNAVSNSNSVQNANSQGNINTAAKSNSNSNVNAAVNGNVDGNSNTNVETAEWKTYENKEYGYSVIYPLLWVNFNRVGEDIVFAEEQGSFPEISIVSMPKTATTFELQKYALQNYVLENNTAQDTTIKGSLAFRLSGLSSTQTSMTNNNNWDLDALLIDGDNYVYLISGREARQYFEDVGNSFTIIK
ncbi:MAG: hypothetical protein PHY34_02355 [Patescibacteria group bacterium]|nr:hypothetical protein [Patescibacteria group bacterium]MDD5715223.1 hypothetical protein [Patescibacteria group bacterium]